jgi:hypothetical protein
MIRQVEDTTLGTIINISPYYMDLSNISIFRSSSDAITDISKLQDPWAPSTTHLLARAIFLTTQLTNALLHSHDAATVILEDWLSISIQSQHAYSQNHLHLFNSSNGVSKTLIVAITPPIHRKRPQHHHYFSHKNYI